VARHREFIRQLYPERLEVGSAVRRIGSHEQPRDIRQHCLVALGELPTALHYGLQLGELYEPNRCLHVGHPVVEPDLLILLQYQTVALVPRGGADVHSVLTETACSSSLSSVPEYQHPTLASGDELAGVE